MAKVYSSIGRAEAHSMDSFTQAEGFEALVNSAAIAGLKMDARFDLDQINAQYSELPPVQAAVGNQQAILDDLVPRFGAFTGYWNTFAGNAARASAEHSFTYWGPASGWANPPRPGDDGVAQQDFTSRLGAMADYLSKEIKDNPGLARR
jgi:hypothetical protein